MWGRIFLLQEFTVIFLEQTSSIWKELKTISRIREIEMEIGNETAEENLKDIVETIKSLGGDEHHSLDGSGRKQMWKLLKAKFPKKCSSSSSRKER